MSDSNTLDRPESSSKDNFENKPETFKQVYYVLEKSHEWLSTIEVSDHTHLAKPIVRQNLENLHKSGQVQKKSEGFKKLYKIETDEIERGENSDKDVTKHLMEQGGRRRFLDGIGCIGALSIASGIASGNDSSSNGSSRQLNPETPDSVDSEWPVPHQDPGRSNYLQESNGPTTNVGKLWENDIGSTLSAPVLAEETIYVGSESGIVLSFDARTGEQLWQQSVGSAAGTPWKINNQLFVPTADSIAAINTDGSKKWETDAPGRLGFLAATHGVYYVSNQGQSSVTAISLEDGSKRWRAAISNPWKPPLLADGDKIMISSNHKCPRPWMFDTQTGEFVGQKRPVPGGYHVGGDDLHYSNGIAIGLDRTYGKVYATDVTTTNGYKWKVKLPRYGGYKFAIDDDHVYALEKSGGGSDLYGLDIESGEIAWNVSRDSEAMRLIAANGIVLVLESNGLSCFNSNTGAEIWRKASNNIGYRFIVSDDLIYTTQESTLRALRSV